MHGPVGGADHDGASSPSDAELMRRHAAGDADAFGEVVARHRERLWAVALRTLGDREEAADAVQDALVSALRASGRGSFRGESAVTTWLHRIVVNACLDRVRRRRAHPSVPLTDDDVPDPGPSDHGRASAGRRAAAVGDGADDRATASVVQAALRTLPADQAVALVLVDMQGWSVADAAAVLDVAPGTVKSRCSRGRARLLPLLAGLRDAPGPAGNPPDPHTVPSATRPQLPGAPPTTGRTEP